MTSTTTHHHPLDDLDDIEPHDDIDHYLHGRRGHTELRTVEYQLGRHTRTKTVTIVTNRKIRISSTTIKENTQS